MVRRSKIDMVIPIDFLLVLSTYILTFRRYEFYGHFITAYFITCNVVLKLVEAAVMLCLCNAIQNEDIKKSYNVCQLLSVICVF